MPKDKEQNIEGLNEQAEKEEETGKKVSRAKFEKLQGELDKALADRDHWKNEYYKAYADTQNLRRSLEEDSRDAVRYRAEGFLDSLLPALDSFHMALDMPAPNKEAENYQIGFGYIYNQIVASLVSEGVSELTPKVGDKFDETTMHAMDLVETEEVPEGCIVRVAAKGYKLHDRLVRAAMVYVAKAPAKKEETNQEAEAPKEASENERHQA